MNQYSSSDPNYVLTSGIRKQLSRFCFPNSHICTKFLYGQQCFFKFQIVTPSFMPADKKTLHIKIFFYQQAFYKKPAGSHQVWPHWICTIFSDRIFIGSIIIKNSFLATKFLSSAGNNIFLARTFPSVPESALPQFSLPHFSTICREVKKQIVSAYLSHSSTASHVPAG